MIKGIQCACGNGYRSRLDHKCGFCRTEGQEALRRRYWRDVEEYAEARRYVYWGTRGAK